MTAGLVLRISPPIEGSKATHHTSPRRGGLSGLIGNVAGQVLYPLRRCALALLVGGHRPIAFYNLPRDHVRPREIIEETADPPPPDNAVQPLINLVIDRDGQFFGHLPSLLIRIIYVLLHCRQSLPMSR